MTKTIKDLIDESHGNAVNKGFWAVNQDIGNKCMLMVTELAEFMEKKRKNDLSADEHCPEFSNQQIELADLFIRWADMCGYLGFENMQEAIEAKMLFNSTRPHLHGKSC